MSSSFQSTWGWPRPGQQGLPRAPEAFSFRMPLSPLPAAGSVLVGVQDGEELTLGAGEHRAHPERAVVG
ncbi:MAG: hypothetical protein ABIZ07_07255, partial [Dermatophilaceae bacterium]